MPAKPLEYGSDKTAFQVFMSSFWNSSGDLYLGSFEDALNRFLEHTDHDQRREFLAELEEVGRSGFVDDIESPEACEFWGSLGNRALSRREYMLALRALTVRGD